jgi:hypothetical protein
MRVAQDSESAGFENEIHADRIPLCAKNKNPLRGEMAGERRLTVLGRQIKAGRKQRFGFKYFRSTL